MRRRRGRRSLLLLAHRALYWSGGSALFLRVSQVRGATILMYHSVADAAEAPWIAPPNRMPPRLFEAQMRFLARHRRVISLSRLVEQIRAGRSPAAGTVVITFDDGYRDTLDVAAPILARFELPMTLFLPTGYVGRAEAQWSDRLHAMFAARTRHELKLGSNGSGPFRLRDERQRAEAYRHVADCLLSAPRAHREEVLNDIGDQLRPVADTPRTTLTWDEVRTLSNRFAGIEIGVHTVNHVDLHAQSAETVRAELAGSIDDVERELGRRPIHLAYPYGRYSAAAESAAGELGLVSAVATEPADLVTAESNRYNLARVESPRSMSLFRFWTSGAYPGLTLAALNRR